MSPPSNPIQHKLTPILIALFAFAIYALTAPTGLTWELGGADGGEFATAVYTQGLAHPPGYPTYLLIAQLVHLIPVGSFAYRLNLFSALSMSIAAALLTTLLQRTDRPIETTVSLKQPKIRVASIMTPLFFITLPLVWSQAIIIEVYALAALFCVILLHLSFSLHEYSGAHFSTTLYLIAFTSGLALGVHYLTAFIPLFASLQVLATPQQRQAIWKRKHLFIIPCFLLGAATYIYLPLRAGHVALANWGNPQTMIDFWAVISGQAYADRLQFDHIPLFLGAVWRTLGNNLGLVGILLAAFGLAQWWEERRPLFIAAIPTITLNLLWVASYNSADILPYLYPTCLIAMLAVGTALNKIEGVVRQKIENQGGQSLVALALALILIVPPAWQTMKTLPAQTDADQYGRLVAQQLPENSILLTFDTQKTFALHYALVVSHPRPDIILISDLLRHEAWYRDDLQTFYPELKTPSLFVSSDQFIAQLPVDRPLYATHSIESHSEHHFVYDSQLDLWQIVPAE